MRTRSKPQADLFVPLPDWQACRVAGVDEAGRGPLAGPVVAAAVILDPDNPIDGLDDSKRLTARKREHLATQIRKSALAFSVAEASAEEIDEINILQATLLAMTRAVSALAVTPENILVDGNRLPRWPYRAEAVVGGDRLVPAISAASILAKTVRDAWAESVHEQWPDYGFDRHKGYPTVAHLEAIRRFGILPVHRRSFGPVRTLLDVSSPEGVSL